MSTTITARRGGAALVAGIAALALAAAPANARSDTAAAAAKPNATVPGCRNPRGSRPT